MKIPRKLVKVNSIMVIRLVSTINRRVILEESIRFLIGCIKMEISNRI